MWNLPNKLTMLRMVMTLIFLVMFTVKIPYHILIAFFLFGFASLTDAFDGRIARSRNLVTNFGKLTDPLADKMLTTAAFLGLMSMGYCNVWIVFLILFREFGISSVRLLAASQGVVIPANIWGKIKTTMMMTLVPTAMFLVSLKEDFGVLSDTFPLVTVSNILCGITCLAAIISGIIYIVQSTKIIDFSK